MRLNVQLELPDTLVIGWSDPSHLEIPDSGRRYLEITIEIDDQAAVDAATRHSPVF